MSFKDVDPSLITTSDGIEYATFCIEYRHNGGTYSAEITASSWPDAQAHVQALVNGLLNNEASLLLLTSRSNHSATIH